AGLTLGEHQYEGFKQKFEEVVSSSIDERLLIPEITIDAELELDDITPKFYRILRQFAPYGPGNMTPVFMSKNLTDTGFGKCVGADETHLKCSVKQKDSQTIGAIGFGLGSKCDLIKHRKPFKAAYSLDINEWNGTKSIQLKLRDLQE
ncbi:MAG: single-stranded-DNA-specific exonuclease RecJ, partial [Bacteroidota bacterium]|nr:single-stranded-DNA-specific exonuclease RecJ [Bacteroidota bacterium]